VFCEIVIWDALRESPTLDTNDQQRLFDLQRLEVVCLRYLDLKTVCRWGETLNDV
jgi:hypothetical protein